jgi:hypothetical protein
MTPEKVLAVVERMRVELSLKEFIARSHVYERIVLTKSGREGWIDRMVARQHLLHVCATIPKLLEENRVEKAMRWVGFLQGAMWALGEFTVAQLADMNRGETSEDRS